MFADLFGHKLIIHDVIKNAKSEDTATIPGDVESKLKDIAANPNIARLETNIGKLINIMYTRYNYNNIYAELVKMKDELEKYIAPLDERQKQEMIKEDISRLVLGC